MWPTSGPHIVSLLTSAPNASKGLALIEIQCEVARGILCAKDLNILVLKILLKGYLYT